MQLTYKLKGGFQAQNFSTFIGAIGSSTGTNAVVKPWLNAWEEWELINAANQSSTAKIHFLDEMGIKNVNWNVYMATNSNLDKVVVQPLLQLDERWQLVLSTDTTSTVEVTSRVEFYIKNVEKGEYCEVKAGGNQNELNLISDITKATKFMFILESVV